MKVVKDCIYGHIALPELCRRFVDVQEFQRLRRIKQLGVVHFTYPSAVHTRFEHSLGVMHLAGKMVDQLANYVFIPARTKELVQLGALYHDVGHLAFSHLFDTALQLMGSPEDLGSDFCSFFKFQKHEDRSVWFLRKVNERLGLLTRQEEEFVEDVMHGHVRDTARPYLYEVVCNKLCGLDVDKMDYLRRDAYHTGFPGFQADYILLNAVLDSKNHLAFRKKAQGDIADLFATRIKMHVNVYQHHTSKKLEKLFLCAIKKVGTLVFELGTQMDDANLETLLRKHVPDIMRNIDERNFGHECEVCHDLQNDCKIPAGGTCDDVSYVD